MTAPVDNWVSTTDRLRLRTRHHEVADARADILVFPGRGDLAEKYDALAGRAADRRVGMHVVDWRGQGRSDRAPGPQSPIPRGALHVDDFAEYQRDVDAFLAPLATDRPRLALAYSMGGLILLHSLVRAEPRTDLRVDAAVLISPMWRFRTATPEPLVGAIARVAVSAGHATSWAAGERWIDPVDCTLDNNMAVDDVDAFEHLQQLRLPRPDEVVTGSTWGWSTAAVAAMRELRRQDLARVRIPITVLSSATDRSVDPREHARMVDRLPHAELLPFTGRHDLLAEGGGVGDAVAEVILDRLDRLLERP